jgi:hypothetical protein
MKSFGNRPAPLTSARGSAGGQASGTFHTHCEAKEKMMMMMMMSKTCLKCDNPFFCGSPYMQPLFSWFIVWSSFFFFFWFVLFVGVRLDGQKSFRAVVQFGLVAAVPAGARSTRGNEKKTHGCSSNCTGRWPGRREDRLFASWALGWTEVIQCGKKQIRN